MSSLIPFAFGTIMMAMIAVTPATAKPLEGVWAGDRMILTATATGARIDGDCATGNISAPLKPDVHGHFQVMGAFQRYRPGAQAEDTADVAHLTRFVGELRGKLLLLTVTGPGEKPEAFRLVKGNSIKLIRCL